MTDDAAAPKGAADITGGAEHPSSSRALKSPTLIFEYHDLINFSVSRDRIPGGTERLGLVLRNPNEKFRFG